MKYKDGLNKKEYDSLTVDAIEASQLKNVSNNDVSVYDRVDDTSKDFAKLDDVTIGTKAESSEFPVYSEMQRFCKDIPINDADYRKNLGNRQK
jgi:hypothetical protein